MSIAAFAFRGFVGGNGVFLNGKMMGDHRKYVSTIDFDRIRCILL